MDRWPIKPGGANLFRGADMKAVSQLYLVVASVLIMVVVILVWLAIGGQLVPAARFIICGALYLTPLHFGVFATVAAGAGC